MVEFIRAWVIGAVAWFMLTNVGSLVFQLLAPAEHVGSFGWALLWLGAIGFAAYFLSVVASALVHRAPDRHRFGRNALAVLAAPVVGTAVDTARLLTGSGVNWTLYLSWTAVALAGATTAFLLMRRVQTPAVVESATGSRVRVPRTYWDRTEPGEREGAVEETGSKDTGAEESRVTSAVGEGEAAGAPEADTEVTADADAHADGVRGETDRAGS
ncbi:hypothetical protein [Streptomonospora wellingtoniae]|uniref:MFS transporter n=1 Tax=Streptomonospora wellingtoniae TaxID=3075544 RepID=A0ABU2KXZ0_9ACTN|nr:hypothetical protein [Streptomonospora sp. DSM 45055]MDT0304107.1 hypothetical protein [Streptomonospora sp. DSM 45055]